MPGPKQADPNRRKTETVWLFASDWFVFLQISHEKEQSPPSPHPQRLFFLFFDFAVLDNRDAKFYSSTPFPPKRTAVTTATVKV